MNASDFDRAVLEACTWCAGRDLTQPSVLWDSATRGINELYGVTPDDVRAVSRRRAEVTREALAPGCVAGWRLLVRMSDINYDYGYLEICSSRFFSTHDVPPPDTWVCLFEAQAGRDALISVVPPKLVPLVSKCLADNPDESVQWLDAVELSLARECGVPYWALDQAKQLGWPAT